jgi:integrase
VQRAARTLQLNWWSKEFAGKSVAEITADAVSKARDACGAETFTRGKPRKDKKTGEMIRPKEYRRSGATVNRYIATLSHLLPFAVKERRLIDRNPVGDIRREKEPRGRTRFLSDEERAALLHACANSEWAPLDALVLLAISTGARRGELVSLKWADVELKAAGRATLHDTKNGEQRTLPLAGKALEALRQRELQNSARSEYLFPSPTMVLDPKTGKPQLDAPYEHFDARWYAALEAAGISDFRFHDLRHGLDARRARGIAPRDCRRVRTQDARNGKALLAPCRRA